MLKSLMKIAIFIGILMGLTYGAIVVLEAGGDVRLSFGDKSHKIQPMTAVLGLVALVLAAWLIKKLLGLALAIFRFFNGDQTAVSAYFSKARERRGLNALTDGVIAYASGDMRQAGAALTRAEKLLQLPVLTNVLQAQIAEASGDDEAARKRYMSLLEEERTKFIAVQGALRQKLASGADGDALKLAQKAAELQPRNEKTLQTLFDLQVKSGHWAAAQKSLHRLVSAGHLPKELGRRREAVLLVADAVEKIEAGEMEQARQMALQAYKYAPSLVPAANLAAQMHLQAGAKRSAASVLKKAWKLEPHPDLARSFAQIEAEESIEARLKRFRPIFAARPEHRETKMVEAELLLAAEDFPAARRALGQIAEQEPTSRSLMIMAAIERGEGAEEHVVRGWLARAIAAPDEAQWCCNACNAVAQTWQARCPDCGRFDTLSWEAVSRAASEKGGETLGLSPTMALLLEPAHAPETTPDATPDASDEEAVLQASEAEDSASDEAAPKEGAAQASAG